MSFKAVPAAYGVASTRGRVGAHQMAGFAPRPEARGRVAKLRVSGTLALALASSAMTIGAAVVVAPEQPQREVTGAITEPSWQRDDDPYIDMFATGPGRGWFAPQPAPRSAPDESGRHGMNR